MKNIFCILLILIISCSSQIYEIDEHTKTSPPTYSDIIVFENEINNFTINIDNNFTLKEREIIYSSINEWQQITNNTFSVRDVNFIYINYSDSRQYTFSLIKEKLFPSKALGLTKWERSSHSANIKLTTDLEPDFLRTVVLHEIGHALDLNHYNGNSYSIMTPEVYAGKNIGCIDVINFCNKWNCVAKCDEKEDLEIKVNVFNLEKDLIEK